MTTPIEPSMGDRVLVPASGSSDTFDARWSHWRGHAEAQDIVWRRRAMATAATVGAVMAGWLVLALYLG
jgi:hypothetical protein